MIDYIQLFFTVQTLFEGRARFQFFYRFSFEESEESRPLEKRLRQRLFHLLKEKESDSEKESGFLQG